MSFMMGFVAVNEEIKSMTLTSRKKDNNYENNQ